MLLQFDTQHFSSRGFDFILSFDGKPKKNKTSSTKRVRVSIRFKLISRDRFKHTLSVIPSFELGKVTVKNSFDYYETADYWEEKFAVLTEYLNEGKSGGRNANTKRIKSF